MRFTANTARLLRDTTAEGLQRVLLLIGIASLEGNTLRARGLSQAVKAELRRRGFLISKPEGDYCWIKW